MFVVEGIHTTVPLHRKVFADADFRRGDFDTKFMERFFEKEKERRLEAGHFLPAPSL